MKTFTSSGKIRTFFPHEEFLYVGARWDIKLIHKITDYEQMKWKIITCLCFVLTNSDVNKTAEISAIITLFNLVMFVFDILFLLFIKYLVYWLCFSGEIHIFQLADFEKLQVSTNVIITSNFNQTGFKCILEVCFCGMCILQTVSKF